MKYFNIIYIWLSILAILFYFLIKIYIYFLSTFPIPKEEREQYYFIIIIINVAKNLLSFLVQD
jgi:hypothetical protein